MNDALKVSIFAFPSRTKVFPNYIMPIVIILVVSVFLNFELHSFVFNIYFIIKCEMLWLSFLLVMNKRLE